MSDQFTLEEREDTLVLKHAWDRVLERMGGQLPETVRAKFLVPLLPVALEGDTAVIVAPGRFIHEWVKDKYSARLQEALTEELGRPVRLDLRMQMREKPVVVSAPISTVVSRADQARFRPVEKFTFDSFVVGQSNRLATAGAKAVASGPGTKYNPLFIYGPSGLGKTHLLHAIANEVLARDPGFPVAYVTAQQFAEEFVFALQNNKIEQFRRSQRSVQMWLVDDVQFIAGKDKTQEELFHTFNYLQGIGKQIVLCSDRPPRDLLLMNERLRSRFESGLVADVQMPDTETRCAILLKKAEQENYGLPMDVAEFLADSVPGSVRILEGALNRIAAQASLMGGSIDLGLAQSIVERYYERVAPPKPSFDQIVASVGKHLSIDVDEIKGTSRKAPIAHARHVAVFLTREILGDSWKHIGALFGNRDHTSMMHGYKKIREMMNRDKDLNASIKMLMRDLYPDI